MTVRADTVSFPRSTMRPAVEGKARGGMSIPVRRLHAPSSTGLGKSGGNGKSVGFDIFLPVDQEGPVAKLIAAVAAIRHAEEANIETGSRSVVVAVEVGSSPMGVWTTIDRHDPVGSARWKVSPSQLSSNWRITQHGVDELEGNGASNDPERACCEIKHRAMPSGREVLTQFEDACITDQNCHCA